VMSIALIHTMNLKGKILFEYRKILFIKMLYTVQTKIEVVVHFLCFYLNQSALVLTGQDCCSQRMLVKGFVLLE